MNGITIAHADPARFEDYKAVFNNSKLIQCYGELLDGWIEKAIAANEAFSAVNAAGEVVGYISIKMDGMFGMPDVTLLGVSESSRGKGVGRELLQFYIGVAACLGYHELGIVVNDFNPRARKLYDSMGFKPRKNMDCIYGLGGLCHLLVKKV